MNIAICDDEPVIAETLRAFVAEYFQRAGIPASTDIFLNATTLLQAQRGYDLLFLDCRLPDINGIELAKAVRQRLPRAEIIFISAYQEYLFESYDVRNFRYILKPLDEAKITKTLDDYLLSFHARKPIFVMADLSIPMDDILYIESVGSNTSVVTRETVYRSRKIMADFENELNPGAFMRVHKSTIIHLGKIQSHCDNTITMIDGKTVKISRRMKPMFLSAYTRYINNHR